MANLRYKNVLLAIGLLVMAAGAVLAISGATPTPVGPPTRWAGNAAGNITTQAGNITALNISGVVLTTKWADFFGNVTGTIVLGNGLANIYSWSYTTTTAGRVCLATNSSWIASGVPSAATGANIDSAWGFPPGDADSGTLTYSSNSCNLNLSGGTISGTGNVTLKGSSTFNDCVISNGVISTGATGNLAFCTNINSTGESYNGVPSNFEVMVPVNQTSTTAYYFYAELG
jgi:hypothetical protein